MSYWVEVHCDVRSDTPDPSKSYGARTCYGHQNSYPCALGSSPQAAAREAISDATRLGWKRRQGVGWVCPHCQKFPALESHP